MDVTARIRMAFLLCLLAAAQQALADEPAARRSQLTLDDLRTFTDVFDQLRSNFVEEIDDATLLRAAIEGMVSELDAYSEFMDADEFRALDDAARGRKGGIGAVVMIQQRRLVVQSVLPDGPASRAGMAPGDIILAIDGQPVRGRQLSSSIDALHGEPGSEVSLRLRSGDGTERGLTLTRSDLPVVSVTGEWLEPGYALLKIAHFHQSTDLEFQQQLETLREAAESPLRGIVLDLRQNLGGVLQAAVSIADGFLDAGLIVNTRSRYAATQLEFQAREGQWATNIPLAVLVDAATASSSEVLAAALQDHGRAVIIGSRTYGKGVVQSILRLRNGAALRLTTAHYFTPNGRSLQGSGVEPDIPADETDPRSLALEWLRSAAADRLPDEDALSAARPAGG